MGHSTDNYVLGRGTLHVGDVASSPTWDEIGNCPSVSLEITEEWLDHFSSRAGTKAKDKRVLLQTQYAVVFECDELTKENLAKFLKGTVSGEQILAFQDTDQEYALKFEEDNPVGPNRTWVFHRGTFSANGALEKIGDDWAKIPLKFEGLEDSTNHSTSPFFTISWTTTTTASPTP